MAFSDDAIGFYLEIEDTTFSTTLARAQRSYERYVDGLEKFNKRAFKSASGALGKLEELVETVSKLPERSLASLKRSAATIAKAIKPMTMKVNLEFTVTSQKRLSKVIGEAVTKALGDARIRLSEGRRLQAIPDLVGRFDIPKLEEGGIVRGPNKAMDSVLALLKPGELVVPADVTKGLMETAGRLQDASGKFISSKPIAEAVANVGNLYTHLKNIRQIADAGLLNDKDVKNYNKSIELLEENLADLDKQLGNLGYSTRVRLAPAIAQIKTGIKEFRQEEEKTSEVSESLLKRILSPVRFLAVRQAIEDVSNVMGELVSNASSTFRTIGGQEIESAVDNVNKMNATLGLTRSELRFVKDQAFETAEGLEGAASADQLTAAMADLAAQGVKDVDMLLRLGKISTLAAEGLGVAADQTNKLGFELTESLGFADQQFAGMLANFGRLSDANSGFNTTAQELLQHTTADVNVMGASLRQLGRKDAENVIDSFNRMGAVMQTQFIEGAGEIRQTLAKAFEGGPENIQAIQQAFLLTGMAQDELRDRLVKGDLTGIFDAIAARAEGMSSDQLRALSEQVGISTGDLQRFAEGQEQVNVNLARSQDLMVQNAQAEEALAQRALDNKTAFQQWTTAVGNSISNIDVYGVKVADVIDLSKEFNVATLLSLGYLAKLGAAGIVAGAKLVGGLGGPLLKVTGLFGKKGLAGGLAKSASGLGAGGTIAGVFTGISTGLTTLAGGVGALGTVLLSPPGIAFTVTFIAALFSLAAALRIANPALQTFGEFAVSAFGKVVEGLHELVPIATTFIDMVGGVFLGAINGAVDVFKSAVEVDPGRLVALGGGLIAMAGGITALAGSMATLGAVQIGSSILSFFTGGPKGPEGAAGFLQSLLDSIGGLTVSGPEQVKALTSTVNNLSGFVLAYARMVQTISDLPSEGFLGGLFGDSAAEKLSENVGPFMDALERVVMRVADIQELSQVPRTAPVPSGAIQAAIEAQAPAGTDENVGEKLDVLAGLLERVVGLLERQTAESRRPEPSPGPARGSRQGSAFTQSVAGGDY